MPIIDKKRVQGIIKVNKEKGQGIDGEKNIENPSQMINASRAFRNLPPEMTTGKEYDGGRRVDRTSIIGATKED